MAMIAVHRRVSGSLIILAAVALVGGCGGAAPRSGGPTTAGTQPPPWTQPATCRVKDLRFVRPTGPAIVDWSRSGSNLLLVNERDGNNNIQLFTIRPDGTDARCLSCVQVPGGPPVGSHKGNAHWHPTGRYIFLQVEFEHRGSRDLAHPGAGRWNDVWATTATGDRWWRLTNYGSNPEAGVLFPVPSPDGRRLAWAERYAGPRRPLQALMSALRAAPVKDLFGYWRLNLADVVIDGQGNVRLQNVRSLAPGGARATFYEMQTWSPRGDKLYFAADIDDPHPFLLDIWSLDLVTNELKPVVKSGENWEEHLTISPSGNKIAFMSSECCSWNPGDFRTLAAETYLMDTDGGNRVQLTHFNRDRPPSSPGLVVAGMSWSPDGRQIAFGRILVTGTEATTKRELWMLTFEGPCGVSP